MISLTDLLVNFGLNMASSAIYDQIKGIVIDDKDKQKIEQFINLNKASVTSSNIIEFLANNGMINIENSKIYASNSIHYKTDHLSNIALRNNTQSRTNTSAIDIGVGCSIEMGNNTSIIQGSDGSIKFCVGS